MKHNIYFADLSPFRPLFASGLPVLCYHKVGRKPAGVKLRGIYVSAGLFSRQMSQLRAEGYCSVSADRLTVDKSPDREVFLTFDDGSLTVLRHAMEPMAAAGFRAINYIVSDLLGGVNEWDTVHGEVPDRLMDETQVREWMSAGHEIGAHTRTHPKLSRLPSAQAREEISGSKKSLEDRFGVPIRHFCYPYGDYSPQIRDMVEEAGYETAVTVDPGVWRRDTDRFLIPRISARAHSLNFRNVFKRLLGRPLVDASPLLS
jgi:peptidoglycan/xylan/chitin deacetylase (PgdA/CDA1 family)